MKPPVATALYMRSFISCLIRVTVPAPPYTSCVYTMATLALSSGAADVAVVQKLLGHNSLATTGIYLDEIREELSEAVRLNPITGETIGRA